MTKMVVVSVRDRAAETFGRPVFTMSVGQAIRSFQDEVNRVAEDNAMNKHPDDFDLFFLGWFDDEFGTFEGEEGGPKQIAIGKQCVVPR